MMRAFGTRAPASFNYRRVDPEFSVWNWTFRADPERALEFLDVTGASRAGLTLNGSGSETVTTAPMWTPGKKVAVQGGSPAIVHADSEGRLTFTVSLGTPHHQQEYTEAQKASPEPFTTVTVSFKPRGHRERRPHS
jgi:hypothetical protein